MTEEASEAGSNGARSHPVEFDVDYPARELNRWTTAFRIILAIPIVFLLSTVGSSPGVDFGDKAVWISSGGLLFLPPLLMLVFRQKYPRWWFEWNRELLRFINRVIVYAALMDDRYPATEEEQSVRLDFSHPPAESLNRWLPLVKWFLAIPHYVVLFFLDIAATVLLIIAWFAILFTGNFPRGIFDFLVGVGRWHNRVVGYAVILVTDRYPPFSLKR